MKNLTYDAQVLNAKLLVLEDAMVSMSADELSALLAEIGYGGKVSELLAEYRQLIVAFRERMVQMEKEND
ncbi:MAG: hypothetical protein LBI13_04405 [Streptococcaceae bacterium]|jgi:N-acetyl-anhydromuramyl-L-alanine amidase AmpD|nr:hypothetical protein [Streptococcaceae bacterium]